MSFSQLSKYTEESKPKTLNVVSSALSLFIFNSVFFRTVFAADAPVVPFDQIAEPIVELINSILNPALLIVGAIGSIYCIIVGVKFAKAEEQQDREKAKAGLRNAAIGFGLIFILIAALRLGIGPLTEWADSFQKSTSQ